VLALRGCDAVGVVMGVSYLGSGVILGTLVLLQAGALFDMGGPLQGSSQSYVRHSVS
jgi:hypothetical protein